MSWLLQSHYIMKFYDQYAKSKVELLIKFKHFTPRENIYHLTSFNNIQHNPERVSLKQ